MKWEDLKRRAEVTWERWVKAANSLADRHPMLGTIRSVFRGFRKRDLSKSSIYFAFHAFIAVLPLILILTGIMGFIFSASPAIRSNINDAIYEMFPDFDVAFKGMLDVMESWRVAALLIGIVLFLWAGVKAAEVLEDGFCIIWGTEKRPYGKRKGVALTVLLVFGTVTVIEAVMNFATPTLIPWVKRQVGGGFSVGVFFAELTVSFLVGFLMYIFVYRFIPTKKLSTAVVVKTAALVSVIMIFVEYVFGFYFNLVYDAKLLYGAMGVMLGILIWLYLVGAIVYMGALLAKNLASRSG